MKPEEFTLNTDFLSLAGTGTAYFAASFGSETFQGGSTFTRERDISINASKGSIDRILIDHNNNGYTVGNSVQVSTGEGYFTIVVFRVNAFTLRVRLHGYAYTTFTMPDQIIRIRIASFKPPNIS